MPNPDPNTPANYSFLPWLRRGIIGLADNGSVPANGAMTLNLSLHATGEGEAPAVVQRPVHLYGPGDISGIDQRAIVRTLPRDGVGEFEYNYLCGIEFYDEDFPWRYTPAMPAKSRLSPWLWLVALKDTEFTRLGPAEGGLMSIEIDGAAMTSAFPDPATTWAWAHTHLNFKPEGADTAAAIQFVETTLDGNPNLGCSRLLCPRRLEPGTHYTAFLLPAFEKGRLAGLGKEQAAIDAVPNAQAAWPATNRVTTIFPIYFEWQYATMADGDFEALARKISPLDKTESDALAGKKKQLDIRRPGWGLFYPGIPATAHNPGNPGQVPFASALIPFSQPASSLLTDSKADVDRTFTKSIETLLNLGATIITSNPRWRTAPNPFFDNSNLQDDPIILPPVYGSFYRSNPAMANSPVPSLLKAALPVTDWYNQVNLNPSMRIAAAQGVAVVQKDQDSYMDRAWDQLNQDHDTTRLVRRWNYSLEVSHTLFAKRFVSMVEDPTMTPGDTSVNAYRTLTFMQPMHPALKAGGKSYSASIEEKFMPAAYSRAFSKIIRPGGPVMKRLVKNTSKGSFFVSMTFPPPPNDVLYDTIQVSLNYLHLLSTERIKFPTRGMDNKLINAGLAGYTPCFDALTALQPYFQLLTIVARPAPMSNADMYTSLSQQINPLVTMPVRLQSMLPWTSLNLASSITVSEPATPEFTEAMYQPLADRSTDFILPGLEQLPANKVALLRTNQLFIEAYMMGLNHEMSREYMWREFPAPLNSTPFRQFWDIRDNQAAFANPETYKDINIISTWGPTGLGTHKPGGRPAENIVLLVRADLLRKYPNTEIFMQQAEWKDNPPRTRGPVAAPVAGVTLRQPIFSAQVRNEYRFVGFDVPAADAIGDANQPGWYFVLKERAGDIHFGLDIDASKTDPSWPGISKETPPGTSINTTGGAFTKLPRYGSRADSIAAMLYQQPFMLFIHVSRLLPKN